MVIGGLKLVADTKELLYPPNRDAVLEALMTRWFEVEER